MSDIGKPVGKRAAVKRAKPREAEAALAASDQSGRTGGEAKGVAETKKCMSLVTLGNGTMPGLTAAYGQMLAEAAAVCLEERQHQSGVRLPRTGLMSEDLYVEWQPVLEQNRRCYADLVQATEWGACGVGILVIQDVTRMVVVERSKKGTGFDYWLGESDYDGLPFQGSRARLEVSGLRSATTAEVLSRIRQKKRQMEPTDGIAPGYVAIVEFSTPIACVEQK